MIPARIEPRDACALRREEHITGPKHRFRLVLDLEGDGATDDAPDHRALSRLVKAYRANACRDL
ncbi:MAG: hypothetical protein ABSF03_29490 [Streptosporangiaceae bacterium]